MMQVRYLPRLCAWMLSLAFFSQLVACQASGPLQGTTGRPNDKKSGEVDKDKEKDDPEAERITPPSNIIGSYLVCIEQEELANIQQNARLQCGVYRDDTRTTTLAVATLKQWQLSGSTAVIQAVSPDSASLVEIRFQAADLNSLKQSIKSARLAVQTDNGSVYQGLVADLIPADNRLSTANAAKVGSFVPVWAEGFEGTGIGPETMLFIDPKTFLMSATVNWVNPATQNAACGLPIFEAMRFATQAGSTDALGPAEGLQFMDTDTACWPDNLVEPIRGPSNLSLSKSLTLLPGRVYRVSFKVRQQPLPPGFAPVVQGLQLKINNRIIQDIRNFGNAWQDITVDWVAGPGASTLEWVDVGAADDSIGVLLDDIRVQFENF